jgi:CHAD domain-containing protein
MEESAILFPEPWLSQLAEHAERLRDDGDGESVHDMRVAAGRLSVWIEIAGRSALHDDLRWLRRSAARLRDIDVMLERERPVEWDALLCEEREQELSHVRSALASTRPRALLEALACVPPLELRTMRAGVRHLVQRVLRAGEKLTPDEQDPHVLHRLRRRLRRLRYALEWTREDARVVKKVQDAFGTFNDRVVEMRHLDSHPVVQLADTVLAELRAEHDQARRDALDSWEKHRAHVRDLARECGPLEG